MYTVFPEVLLHEHLDGSLRVDTILELASEYGYRDLPTTDADGLTEWFDQGESESRRAISNPSAIPHAPSDHPVGALHRAGFAITLNTDNRVMSRTSMSNEFALVAEHHGLTIRDLEQVTERAMMAAFCSLPTKERLLTERIRPGYEMAVR